MDPDVSILIPVRNMEATLARAVASVADGVSEIVIVDDGSTDRTDEVIDQIILQFDKCKIVKVRQRQLGIGEALNAGLAACKGRYILRQDADDVSYSPRLELLMRGFNSRYLHCPAIASWFAHLKTGKVNHGMIHAFPPMLTTEDLLSGWRFPHGPAMYRRAQLERVGGWPEDMDCSEDHLLHLRLSRLGPLAVLPVVLYFVGDSPDRQTRVKDSALWDECAQRIFHKEAN